MPDATSMAVIVADRRELSMASNLRFPVDAAALDGLKLYSLCYFEADAVVPTVELLDAKSDAEAVAMATGRQLWSTREVWNHHRLVARILPAY